MCAPTGEPGNVLSQRPISSLVDHYLGQIVSVVVASFTTASVSQETAATAQIIGGWCQGWRESPQRHADRREHQV